MTTYAVIGAGAVGGFYGIHLARSGSDVHFLIRGTPRSEPLVLDSPRGTVELVPGRDCEVHGDIATLPRADIVIVAVKSAGNADVVSRLAGVVKPGGAVVLLQNGLGVEPSYAEHLPRGIDLIGGLAFLASHRESPGRFVHVDYGALTLGGFLPGYAPGGVSPAMEQVAADLARADIPVHLVDDLLAARWQKLVWNVPFNGLTVLLDSRTDAIVADPGAVEIVTDLMAEVVQAALADGRRLPSDVVQQMLDLTRSMRPYAPSMKLDFDHKRPLELDVMYRAVLARAASSGVAMPRTQMLTRALTVLDARNRAG